MTRVNLGRDSSGRPLVVDTTWLAKLRAAETLLGFKFTIVQGSWRGEHGAAASAGTHDRGGVGDLRTWNIPASIGIRKALTVLRECGLIAWYRTPAQGFDYHIHAIDYGNPDLAPSAARQVTSWANGRNGLANNGPDDGPRVHIPKTPPPDPEEISMGDISKILAKLEQLDADIKDVRARIEDDNHALGRMEQWAAHEAGGWGPYKKVVEK